MSGFEGLLTGRVLVERYRIAEVIGRGGMGAVYRATDERLGRPVAVKVITVTGGSDVEARDRIRARFRHEASAAARLPHHPNVVPVYDYGTDPTLQLDFLVMELLRGEDLASRLARSGPPPLSEALRILQHAARGVAIGHRAGLIHRDVKPGNIFLVRTDDPDELQVRVLDFGIAKLIADEETDGQLTQDGRAPLSPAYASPEQLRGEARLTPASDVFSLGAVGYQLLTGERPFSETDRNRLAIGNEVPLPSLRARNAGIPEAVEMIIRRSVALNPGERFPQAGALADAVERVLRGLGEAPAPFVGAWTPPVGDADHTQLAGDDDRTMLAPAGGPAAAPAYVPPPSAGPAIPPPRRLREEERTGTGTGKKVLLGLLLLLLAGGGIFAFQAAQSGNEPREHPLANLSDSAAVQTDSTRPPPEATDALAADLEGRRFLRRGEYPTALQHFERAVEIDPDNVEYRDHLAFTLLRMGRPEEAARQLEEAIRLNPNSDILYSHIADARLALGDTAAAISALRRFLEISIAQGDRDIAQRKLAALEATQVPAPAPERVPEPVPVDSTAPSDTIFIPPIPR